MLYRNEMLKIIKTAFAAEEKKQKCYDAAAHEPAEVPVLGNHAWF